VFYKPVYPEKNPLIPFSGCMDSDILVPFKPERRIDVDANARLACYSLNYGPVWNNQDAGTGTMPRCASLRSSELLLASSRDFQKDDKHNT